MPGHDIIVVGASAGGVEALSQLVAGLPKDLPAAVFVVIHIPAQSKSVLPHILSRRGQLLANHGKDGDLIAPGRIYVAPPDYHLLVKRGYIRLVQGPKENNCRPAVDPLFRTAAKAYGCRVVGVILSGTLDDGTAGLIDVKRLGGVAVVQNPDEAAYKGMPSSAIEHVAVDHILPVSSIASLLVRLVHERVVEEGAQTMPSDREMEIEPDVVELDGATLRSRGHPGPPSRFTCPDCGGTLFQLNERNLLQFRCRTGHAYSAATLMAQQSEVQEEALWAAMRSLEERADLMHQMASKAQVNNRNLSAKRYDTMALEAEQRADLIRKALFQGQLPVTVKADAIAQETGNRELGVGNTESTDDSPFKVVVLAASVGGLKALSEILPAFPPDFPAAIIVVQHLDTQSRSNVMTDAVYHPATLPVKLAQEGEFVQPGMVYIAPLEKHLLVNSKGILSLSEAVFVDFISPSADLLLQSVAASFKEHAIAVVLSGTGSDGALGVQAIHKMGGKVIAQDESTCECCEMPNAAIQTGKVDFVLPVSAIAS
ncbi:MAG TPA: chemotaxis protein CheB, partial [Cyanobacteria bacterium UBA8553]|nr:chemotaxis protein CheB [Cyanobacteria bacterium UBA8553]